MGATGQTEVRFFYFLLLGAWLVVKVRIFSSHSVRKSRIVLLTFSPLNVLRKAYTRNSSAGRRIGCMLRQHSLSLRRLPCYRYGGAAFKRMIGMDILKSVRYYDDDDELYCEYDITFEYNGKKYLVIHFFAFSGAWNKKLIGHIPDGFERLYGGGVSDFSFKDTTFTYGELIEAAELLEFSGKEELCYADYEGDGNDNEAKKFREQMQNLQIPR